MESTTSIFIRLQVAVYIYILLDLPHESLLVYTYMSESKYSERASEGEKANKR